MYNLRQESGVGIAAMQYELPGAPVDIVEYGKSEGICESRIERLLGNGVRYFYDGTDRSDSDMIIAAVNKIIDGRGSDWLADVSYVIHARTQAFSTPPPPTSIPSEVCAHFGIEPKLSFGIEQLACAGVVRALDWARRLLVSNQEARYALVITSDRVFGDHKYRLRQDGGVQCDAGTAMLVAKEDLICQFDVISSKSFNGLYEGPSTAKLEAEIARMTLTQTKESLEKHAIECDTTIDEFSRLLPINADRLYWEKIAEYLGVSRDAFFLDNIERCGHACCGDLAINVIDGGLSEIAAGGSIVYCGQSNLGIYENISLCPPQPKLASKEVMYV